MLNYTQQYKAKPLQSLHNCPLCWRNLVRIHMWVLRGRRAPKAEWGGKHGGVQTTHLKERERERQVDLFKEWGVGESNFNGFWECASRSLAPPSNLPLASFLLCSRLTFSSFSPLLPQTRFSPVTHKHGALPLFDRHISTHLGVATQIKVLFMLSGIK